MSYAQPAQLPGDSVYLGGPRLRFAGLHLADVNGSYATGVLTHYLTVNVQIALPGVAYEHEWKVGIGLERRPNGLDLVPRLSADRG